MMNTLMPLTSSLKVHPGSHILYFYNSLEGYIENAASYILKGIEQGQHVIFIDDKKRFELVMEKLRSTDTSNVHYVDAYEFYGMNDEFYCDRVLANLKKAIEPYLEKDRIIRIWGHVDWRDQDHVVNKLHTYECNCDITVSELGFTTVCAYDGEKVPSNILLEMSKSHEYLMTDDELVRSNLYKTSNEHNPTIFPSLSAQMKIESEMDFYKQKLDFVHVVSHEVRNPLTVIKSFAQLLELQEDDEDRRFRLEQIKNYAAVIDNEISHIISTEQMLSTDALWQKKFIMAKPIIDEVVETMMIKAQTQNIALKTDICLHGKEMILSNSMGFKMILSNLLSNAIKYSLEEDTVYFSVHSDDESLVIKVEDEGVGMSQKQLEKLYNKYEKINQEQSGQGIGLFMVKKLVDDFQGTIEVQSEQGVGTTFTVTIPFCC
ncbi:two-component sensor histidine kinase [Texcoconibacillus texcoconensis]|uniref:histidine kinase n=2 Tax=Texcoconibacillus texcoconensis TaxID=1095777 RepID=A0A840QTX0_9BACI|nr:two-component sensor histidine kinase [Texcoconibacillus texcoconensis]